MEHPPGGGQHSDTELSRVPGPREGSLPRAALTVGLTGLCSHAARRWSEAWRTAQAPRQPGGAPRPDGKPAKPQRAGGVGRQATQEAARRPPWRRQRGAAHDSPLCSKTEKGLSVQPVTGHTFRRQNHSCALGIRAGGCQLSPRPPSEPWGALACPASLVDVC